MTFREILRNALDDKGWGESDLAEATGIPKTSIHSYMIGVMPSTERFENICRAVGLDPYDLPLEDAKENITVTEAAHRMQKRPEFIKACIINGTMPGITDGRGGFHIPRKWFEKYMQGLM